MTSWQSEQYDVMRMRTFNNSPTVKAEITSNTLQITQIYSFTSEYVQQVKTASTCLWSGYGNEFNMCTTWNNSCQAQDHISFIFMAYSFPNKNTGHKQESSKFTMLKPVAGEQTATQKHVYNGGRSVHSSGEIWKWGWRQNIDTGTERDFSVLSPLRHNLTNNYTLQEGTISVCFGDYMVSLVRKLVAVIVLFMGKVPSYFKLPPAPSVSWVGNYPTLTLPTGKSQTTQPSTQSLPHYKRSSAIYG